MAHYLAKKMCLKTSFFDATKFPQFCWKFIIVLYYVYISGRSVELAGCSKLLAGQKVFLSPSIKPPPSEMADIITCSGGEVMTTLPYPPGVGVLIVASPDDLSMLSTAVEAGMAVHSTEIILGGVLRQELDLTAYPTSNWFLDYFIILPYFNLCIL